MPIKFHKPLIFPLNYLGYKITLETELIQPEQRKRILDYPGERNDYNFIFEAVKENEKLLTMDIDFNKGYTRIKEMVSDKINSNV